VLCMQTLLAASDHSHQILHPKGFRQPCVKPGIQAPTTGVAAQHVTVVSGTFKQAPLSLAHVGLVIVI
jgi:hypothetical protein